MLSDRVGVEYLKLKSWRVLELGMTTDGRGWSSMGEKIQYWCKGCDLRG